MLQIIIVSVRNTAKAYCTKVTDKHSLFEIKRKLKIGQRVTTGRIVTIDDVTNFAKLTDDYNPIHIEIPKKIVHGALLNGFLSGVLGTQLPGPGTIVLEQLIRYPKPCYVGDAIEISVEILSTRKIIKCKYSIVSNSESIVLEGEGKFIMRSLSSSND